MKESKEQEKLQSTLDTVELLLAADEFETKSMTVKKLDALLSVMNVTAKRHNDEGIVSEGSPKKDDKIRALEGISKAQVQQQYDALRAELAAQQQAAPQST